MINICNGGDYMSGLKEITYSSEYVAELERKKDRIFKRRKCINQT